MNSNTHKPSKITKFLLIGMTVFMLSIAGYSTVTDSFFTKGPKPVLADDFGDGNNSGDSSNNSSNNDCSCGNESQVDNNQNSDNVSNQNDSEDNPAYNPSPTPTSTPTATPTPSATPTPTPSPVVTPSPVISPSPVVTPTPTPLNIVQCPVGQIAQIVNSTVVCVSQNQEQTQTQTNTQTQENNNKQEVKVEVNPHIENHNDITVNNPAVQVAGVSVINQTPVSVKELPKTGLPLAAVAFSSLLPVGSRLRKLGKKNTEESANSIWIQKQLGQ